MITAFPYSRFATTYDRVLGAPFFWRVRRAFEAVVRRNGLAFRSAADVGCGTGLFACYLRRCWNVAVVAVDRSREMLDQARCNCPGAGVCFLQQDLRELQLPRPVDLITANFDTVNHLVKEGDLLRGFRRLYANLSPGGHLYFDVITACRPLGGRLVYQRCHGRGWPRVAQIIHWEPRRRLLYCRIVHQSSPCACSVVERHLERAYLPREIGTWLGAAGFLIRDVLDEATLLPPQCCPRRLLVLARRPQDSHCSDSRRL
jgi:SAM-dependent methyltransferase